MVYKSTNIETVGQNLRSTGFKLLNTSIPNKRNYSSSKDYESWKKILEETSTKNKVKEFGKWNKDSIMEYKKINRLKQECQKLLHVGEKESHFNNAIEKAKEFCVEK